MQHVVSYAFTAIVADTMVSLHCIAAHPVGVRQHSARSASSHYISSIWQTGASYNSCSGTSWSFSFTSLMCTEALAPCGPRVTRGTRFPVAPGGVAGDTRALHRYRHLFPGGRTTLVIPRGTARYSHPPRRCSRHAVGGPRSLPGSGASPCLARGGTRSPTGRGGAGVPLVPRGGAVSRRRTGRLPRPRPALLPWGLLCWPPPVPSQYRLRSYRMRF